MKKLSLLTACLFTLFVSQAQSDSTWAEEQESLTVPISEMNNNMIKEKIVVVKDSQVLVLGSFNYQQTIPFKNYKPVVEKRRNSVLTGALIGFGVGAIPGVLFGKAVSDIDDGRALWPMVGCGVVTGAGGALIGALIGALAKKKFTIGDKKAKTRDLQSELMTKLVLK